jgi:DNA-binding Lrp family transcriptional regulator
MSTENSAKNQLVSKYCQLFSRVKVNYLYKVYVVYVKTHICLRKFYLSATNYPTGINMNNTVEIDEIDVKILRELIKDARAKLKDIAKTCGVSSTAIMNRIKRLKTTGVITGAVQYIDMARLGYMQPATIGINLNYSQEAQVIKLIRERAKVIMFDQSVGKNDLSIFCVAKNIKELDDLKQLIKKQPQIRRVTINLWSTPYPNFEKLDIQPTRA